MIHIQESEKRKIDTTRFNDAFMMHGSTSPHYGILASLDVSSAMMAGSSGRAIVQETHDEAMHFRRALAMLGPDGAEGAMLDATRWLEGAAEQAEGRFDAPLEALSRAIIELGEAFGGVDETAGG